MMLGLMGCLCFSGAKLDTLIGVRFAAQSLALNPNVQMRTDSWRLTPCSWRFTLEQQLYNEEGISWSHIEWHPGIILHWKCWCIKKAGGYILLHSSEGGSHHDIDLAAFQAR